MQPEKSKIKNLSTRYLKFYKYGISVIIASLIIRYGYFEYSSIKAGGEFDLIVPLIFGYLMFVWFWINQHVYNVDDFLYIIRGSQNLPIRLEKVKDVNLVSMGGVYRVDLLVAEEFGDRFYFKPSLLYPVNFKKKEALVNILWTNIENAKRTQPPPKRISRIRNLSTRYLEFYKHSVSVIIAGLAISYLYSEYISYKEDGEFSVFMPLLYGYVMFIWFWVNQRVYHVEFDDDFLYVMQSTQDLLIPLENIKDVNLVSLGGVYRVDLYAKETFGDKFYFKPSLLYPFNFKKKEAMVDILWANIEKAKRKKQHFQRNALHS
jgi:hypothetical protein